MANKNSGRSDRGLNQRLMENNMRFRTDTNKLISTGSNTTEIIVSGTIEPFSHSEEK